MNWWQRIRVWYFQHTYLQARLDYLKQELHFQEDLSYSIITYLTQKNNRLARDLERLKIRLNRIRFKRPNWIKQRFLDLDEERMLIYRIQVREYIRHEFAIWTTDLDMFPCISWVFEVT